MTIETTPMFSDKDLPLRDDVRTLGNLLGTLLKEQEGETLFQLVETARLAARERRSGEKKAETKLGHALENLSPNESIGVVHAFSTYFSLVNLAERVHRLRRRRTYLQSDKTLQPGSLKAVLKYLKENGVTKEEIQTLLEQMKIVPVFTAHPTEAVRRTLLVKEQRMARALVDRLNPEYLTPNEEKAALARVQNEASIAWQTEEHLSERPTVADEVEHVIFYLSEVIYRVIPVFYEELSNALEHVFGQDISQNLTKPIIRFASWVGGDMDGNPNVGPDTISQTLSRHFELIIKRYQKEVRQLFDHLSQSTTQISVDKEVIAQIELYRASMPNEFAKISTRYHEMPYRMLLWLISDRLAATKEQQGFFYQTPKEFLEDIQLIARSLRHNKGQQAGIFWVTRLIRRIETFGFHLATLDIRQDALLHRKIVGEILEISDFEQRSADERCQLLENALAKPVSTPRQDYSEEAQKILAVFSAIRTGRKQYGEEALGPYIMSMTQGPDDILALLYLARAGGLVDQNDRVPLDIVPLFETVVDLESAQRTLQTLLDHPLYQKHLQARNDEQMIMLGYSDSNKESGIAASRFALYQAQSQLLETCESQGIKLTLFHGRGGTISRGGSKTRSAILAEPPGAVQGKLRVTEQGEIIHAKYGLRGIANRTLELTCGAVLEASLQKQNPPADAWQNAIQKLAKESRRAYRDLVYHNNDFYEYFRYATPIDVIERMHIGSRPPSRRSKQGISNLRAIPWVFAWTQSRHILTGWFGMGTGLSVLKEELGTSFLQEMEQGWSFFHNLLADVEMVLAKADMNIAARYAKLSKNTGEKIYPKIKEEFEKTRAILAEIKQQNNLLDSEPVLQRSIRLRNPYIDPMSLLQVDLLTRWRAGERQDKELERALLSTIKGIARGLQNTG